MAESIGKCANCEMVAPEHPGVFLGLKHGTKVAAFGLRIASASRAKCGHFEIIAVQYMDDQQQWYRLITKRHGLNSKCRKALGSIPYGTVAAFDSSTWIEIDVVGSMDGSDDAPEGFEQCGPSMVLTDVQVAR